MFSHVTGRRGTVAEEERTATMTTQESVSPLPTRRGADPSASGPAPGRKPARRRRRRRRVLACIAAVLAVLAVPTGMSYYSALTAPGAGPWDVATVTWLDDHGLAPVVNTVETLIYSLKSPPARATVPAGDVPGTTAGNAAGGQSSSTSPAVIPPAVPWPALSGEGQWSPAGPVVAGSPTVWTTFFRPDPTHTGVLAGVMQIDQSRSATTLVPGLTEPGPVAGALPSSVPPGMRGALVATFNAGYRFRDAPGGFYLAGHSAKPLRSGGASLVIGTDGRVDVRAWTGGPVPSADVVAVRQNLDLVVRNGKPVPGLATNADRAWGSTGQPAQYTMRTGAGITAGGDLVVVEGGTMTLPTLADTLVRAGVVTGMQLDIHTSQVSASTFLPDSTSAAGTRATALLPTQSRPAARYLSADQRDFFAVFVRGTALPGEQP
jgi:hypothetical protein